MATSIVSSQSRRLFSPSAQRCLPQYSRSNIVSALPKAFTLVSLPFVSSRTQRRYIRTAAMGSLNGTTSEKPHSAWVGAKSPAAFDLRSDVVTTPTPAMLAAVQSCSLLDDVFHEDPATIDLEAYVAKRTGKEAGLFVLSGTMGNQVALRSLLTQPPHSVVCDYRSHIYTCEAGGTSSLTGAQMQPVVPRNGRYLTLEDIQENVCIDDDVHSCPTRVISLENTLHGMVTPLEEIKRIADFAKEHSIKMHLDGARIWEACVAGSGSLPDICSHFDTVSLCLSKGLGAPIGSVLVGTKATIKHSRWVRKSIGGGLRQSGVVTSAGRVAIEQTFGESDNGEGSLLKASHETARKVEALWKSMGGQVAEPTETNMCWLDLKAVGCSEKRLIEIGQQEGLKFVGNRLVTHYQVAQNEEEVLKRLRAVFEKVLSVKEDLSGTGVGKSSVYVPR